MGVLLSRLVNLTNDGMRRCIRDLTVCCTRAWQPRRVIISSESIHFTFQQETTEIDHIPLAEVNGIQEIDHEEVQCDVNEDNGTADKYYVVQIGTTAEGYNSGRAYYLRCDSKKAFDELLEQIRQYAKAAKKKAQAHTLFQSAQCKAKKISSSFVFQSWAVMIIGLVNQSDSSSAREA